MATTPELSVPADRTPVAPGASVDPGGTHRDLKGRTIRGAFTAIVAQSLRSVLHMGSTVVLARLLTPADYGLVGMVSAVVGFVSLFKDLGLSTATIQRQEITHRQVSSLFWINVCISVVLALMTAVSAPLVARFYGEPRLVAITLALSVTFVFGGLTAQHHALLQRHMRFKALGAIDILAMAVGVCVGVVLAALGFGYWALVAQGATAAATNMVLAWRMSGWWPGRPAIDPQVRSMLAFGGGLTGFSAINYLVRNLDNVLIGWCWGAGALGIYAKAYDLLLMPLRRVNAPISSVAVPVLSRLQADHARYRRYYLTAMALVTSVGMPVVVFTALMADRLIPLLLGDQWAGAVLIYRILAAAAFMDTFNVATGWVWVSTGQAGRQLRWQVIDSMVTIAGFAIGLPWGPMGVAVGFSVARCLTRVPSLAYCFAESPVRFGDFVKAVWRPAASSIISGGALLMVPLADTSVVAQLAIATVVFAAIYGTLWLVLPGGRAQLGRIVEIARELRGRRLGAAQRTPDAGGPA